MKADVVLAPAIEIILFNPYSFFNFFNPFIDAYSGLTSTDFKNGFLKGTLPQFPLTLLNSVISVVDLSHTLVPESRDKLNIVNMASSVGLMNIIGVWFGALSSCHGSGGLAGQWRFGARSGLSIVMLGIMKILVSIFLGGVMTDLLSSFPNSISGVMLIVCGRS